jgi:methionyl-tRNA formyltransferase
MKILLFLNSDIHSAKALEILFSDLKKHEVKIILSQNVGKVLDLSSEIVEMKRLEKFGAEESLRNLARNLNSEIVGFDDVNAPSSIDELAKFSPDLAISIRFGQIFKSGIIGLPRLGVLNLHSGILPNYRGVMASFWAILNGEKKLGTTLHYVRDSGIDTGDVVGFSEKEIDWDCSLLVNINQLYHGGCGLILEALQKVSMGEKIQTIDQKTLGAGSYFSYPKQSDVDGFLKLMRFF